MRIEECTFFSDEFQLEGAFLLPDSFDDTTPQPLVLPCSGFTGLRCIHPERFARYLTAKGFCCFGFDYRGFGSSQGVRGRVILDEQVRDIMHATAYAQGDERIDADRIILLGWGMGAGLVLDAARSLPGIAGLVAVNGFYDGRRVQRAHRGEQGYEQFRRAMHEQAKSRVRTGRSVTGDPFDYYPLDAQSRKYVDEVLRQEKDYDTDSYAAELGESLLRFVPEAYAAELRIPLLVAHGDENALHPPSEAEHLLSAYGGAKELYWIRGGGHTEWMFDDDPKFSALGERIAGWMAQLLGTG